METRRASLSERRINVLIVPCGMETDETVNEVPLDDLY